MNGATAVPFGLRLLFHQKLLRLAILELTNISFLLLSSLLVL